MPRGFVRVIMVALLGVLMITPVVTSAQADTCDTTCIYNQLLNHQIPIPPDGASTYFPYKDGRYYIGPNGLEIRLNRDTSWKFIEATVGLSTGGASLIETGSVLGLGDLITTALLPERIRGAANLLSIPGSYGLDQVAQSVVQRDNCLGITIPGGSLGASLQRGMALIGGQLWTALSPSSPNDIKIWFESCSNERASGLGDYATQPLGIMTGNLTQATAASAIPVTNASAATMASLGTDQLKPGTKMYPNQYLTSLDGRFVLTLQGDGNLVEYGPGYTPIWSSGTSGRSVDCAMAQGDGNVVLYGANNSGPIWSTNTDDSSGASWKVQEDGNVVAYNPNGVALWSTGTAQATTGGTYDGTDTLQGGAWLRPGHYLRSGDFRYTLFMQNDGNLVLWSPGKRILWTSGTGGHTGVDGLLQQQDGNTVLYAHGAIWSTGIGGAGPFKLLVQNDGNLVVYSANGAIWSTGTGGKI
jgi:hypothetical protein